jgi:hypothetical protein
MYIAAARGTLYGVAARAAVGRRRQIVDPDDVHWLSCLVWPGEGDRAERLAAAIDLAGRDPPPIVRGAYAR